jgi:hydroxymethylpyrimidine/phosphomethylpyrimidine kinase
VIDPVMIAKGGQSLLEADARRALVEQLLPLCALVTPNAPEAAALAGLPVESYEQMARAADNLLALGASAVLVKGGHIETDPVMDLLRTADGVEYWFESPRLRTRSTHGTGCTLASAIAAGIAYGLTLRDAVDRARTYVHRAIATAPGYGSGFGPLNHAHPLGPDE